MECIETTYLLSCSVWHLKLRSVVKHACEAKQRKTVLSNFSDDYMLITIINLKVFWLS